MDVIVERLDNGDLAFRCAVCDECTILPRRVMSLSTTRYYVKLGKTLAAVLFHNTSHVRESGVEVRTGDIGGHNGTI